MKSAAADYAVRSICSPDGTHVFFSAAIRGLMAEWPTARHTLVVREAYAPLARAILGGLTVSVALTVLLVPAAYVWVYGKE